MTQSAENLFVQKDWLTSVNEWVRSRLKQSGYTLIGEPDQFHIRDWSTVIRFHTHKKDFYFKVGAENQHFEAAFLELLHQKNPRESLGPLAVDIDRGWMLLPDGGQSLRAFENGKINQSNWKKMLLDFAHFQIGLSEYAIDFLATGLLDLRLENLGSAYDHILASKEMLINGGQEGLDEEEYEKLAEMKSYFRALLEELQAYSIPPSIDHGDLHDGNVFFNQGRITFFDWGDASLSHPFICLMIPLRVLGNYLDMEPENHPDLHWARQAYLEPWTDFLSMKNLTEAWDLALHIGRLHRSISWYKLARISRRRNNFDYDAHFSGWVRKFIHHPFIPPIKEAADAK